MPMAPPPFSHPLAHLFVSVYFMMAEYLLECHTFILSQRMNLHGALLFLIYLTYLCVKNAIISFLLSFLVFLSVVLLLYISVLSIILFPCLPLYHPLFLSSSFVFPIFDSLYIIILLCLPIPHTSFSCVHSSPSSSSPGEFMPNDLSVDINTNQRLDIMRCKMTGGEDAYMNLARSNQEITVEIFREKTPLIVFTVPWNTRVQSKFLSHPRDVPDDASMGMSTNPWASKFDPWMGFDRETPGVWKREKLFMCVPGLETPPSRKVCTVCITNLQCALLILFD